MARFLLQDFGKSERRGRCLYLALFWIAGLTMGALMFVHANASFISLMHSARMVPVSISGLVSVILFPFLISAFSAYTSLRWTLYMLVFGKAFGFCLTVFSCASAFGSASWLICPLLFFSDVGTVFTLWLFWLHCSVGDRGLSIKTWLLCLMVASLFGIVDICFVSPFLAVL